jgi:hypothetical protein
VDINGAPYGSPSGDPDGPQNTTPTPVTRIDAGRSRRLALAIAGGALIALVGFGAVATTFAADPSPSPSAGTEATPAPDRNKAGNGTHRGGTRGDCANKGDRGNGSGNGGSGNGGSGGGATPQTPESPSPSESPSDVPESL